MKEKIRGLIELQDCDNKIKELIARKNKGPLKIQQLENELTAGEAKFQEVNNKLEERKNERRKIEQDVQELESKIEKSNIKLNNIKSNKEYGAALKEIDSLNKEKVLVEDKILQIMEEIEELEEISLHGKDEQAELNKKFKLDKNAIDEELLALDKEIRFHEKQREKFQAALDQDMLKKYLFIKERKGGQAIGPVVDGICQTCHMGIPPQQFNELIRGNDILICPNCNRMIYWGEDEFLQKPIETALGI